MPYSSFIQNLKRTSWWPIATFFLVYIGVLICAQTNLLFFDGDPFWQVATGDWILSHKSIPTVDPFSAQAQGRPWVVHYWLSSVVLAMAKQTLGWAGCIIITALAVASSLSLMMAALERYITSRIAFIMVMVSFALITSHMIPRPHILILPFAMIWIIGLVRANVEHRSPSWWLLLPFWIWVNLHGIDAIVGGCIAVSFAMDALSVVKTKEELWDGFKGWGLFIGVSLVISLLTPVGFASWALPFQFNGSYIAQHIAELNGLVPSVNPFFEIWFIVVFGFCLYNGVSFPPVRLCMFIGIIILLFQHFYVIQLFALLTPFLLVEPFRYALEPRWNPRAFIQQRSSWFSIMLSLALFLGISVFAINSLQLTSAVKWAPINAVNRAKQLGLNGPVFNEDLFGGYLINNNVRPYFDGRMEIYGDQFFHEYMCAMSGGVFLTRLLDRDHIMWTLFPPASPVVAALENNPDWELVYHDKTAVIFKRKNQAIRSDAHVSLQSKKSVAICP